MPETEDDIQTVLEYLHESLEKAHHRQHDEKIIRFAVYLFARNVLEERIRDIVWLEEPFPEVGDTEAAHA